MYGRPSVGRVNRADSAKAENIFFSNSFRV
jgi:hypothetical protein